MVLYEHEKSLLDMQCKKLMNLKNEVIELLKIT